MSGAAQAVQAAIVRVDCAAWFKTLQRGTDTKLVGRPDSCNLHRFANLYFIGYIRSEIERCGLAGAKALRSAEERFQKGSCRAAGFCRSAVFSTELLQCLDTF